jgi:hypothetical protein
LNTDAPRRAALVRKPARREWAPKSAAQRAVAETLEVVGSGKGHGAGCLGQDGRFAGWGSTNGAADAAERGAHVLGIGRRLQVGEPMGVADGGTGARPRSASRARKPGTVAGLAGNALTPLPWHHSRNMAKSLR